MLVPMQPPARPRNPVKLQVMAAWMIWFFLSLTVAGYYFVGWVTFRPEAGKGHLSVRAILIFARLAGALSLGLMILRRSRVMVLSSRIEGGANVQRAAEESGVRRYVVQSGAFVFAPGQGLADERAPFAVDAPAGVAATARMYDDVERRAQQSPKMEVLILRYGIFYGPGAWFDKDGDIADQVRSRRFPVIGQGQGVWSFVHAADAAAATVAALRAAPGIYNIVDDQPIGLGVWLPAFADWVGAPPPPKR